MPIMSVPFSNKMLNALNSYLSETSGKRARVRRNKFKKPITQEIAGLHRITSELRETKHYKNLPPILINSRGELMNGRHRTVMAFAKGFKRIKAVVLP